MYRSLHYAGILLVLSVAMILLEYMNLILDNHKTANTHSYGDADGGCIFIDWKNGPQEEEEMTSQKDN